MVRRSFGEGSFVLRTSAFKELARLVKAATQLLVMIGLQFAERFLMFLVSLLESGRRVGKLCTKFDERRLVLFFHLGDEDVMLSFLHTNSFLMCGLELLNVRGMCCLSLLQGLKKISLALLKVVQGCLELGLLLLRLLEGLRQLYLTCLEVSMFLSPCARTIKSSSCFLRRALSSMLML